MMQGGLKFILFFAIGAFVIFFANDFLTPFFSYAFPDWLAVWIGYAFIAILIFTMIQGFGQGFGTLATSPVQAFKMLFGWTWPFWIAPAATLFVMITPLSLLAPKGLELEFSRALSIFVVVAGAWLFWQFSRLQEVSRDVGAWISLIASLIIIVQSLLAGSHLITGISLLATSFAIYAARYMIGISPDQTAYKSFGFASRLSFYASILFIILGIISHITGGLFGETKEKAGAAIEKIAEKKDALIEKKDELLEKAGGVEGIKEIAVDKAKTATEKVKESALVKMLTPEKTIENLSDEERNAWMMQIYDACVAEKSKVIADTEYVQKNCTLKSQILVTRSQGFFGSKDLVTDLKDFSIAWDFISRDDLDRSMTLAAGLLDSSSIAESPLLTQSVTNECLSENLKQLPTCQKMHKLFSVSPNLLAE